MKSDPMVAEGYIDIHADSINDSMMIKWNKKKMICQYSVTILWNL